MKAVSYIADIGVFCVMLFVFNVNFIASFFVSMAVGIGIRHFFCRGK
ncbi:MAG: hypothetical protein KAI66_23345 [Lentisphaeria bacterium]|nr:hypothetical protein [Lentisphaeria bacterium]